MLYPRESTGTVAEEELHERHRVVSVTTLFHGDKANVLLHSMANPAWLFKLLPETDSF